MVYPCRGVELIGDTGILLKREIPHPFMDII
jgi:hypothetical protein